MRRMNVREFRSEFSKVTEPVEVLRGTETLGTWTPAKIKNTISEDASPFAGLSKQDREYMERKAGMR